MHNNIVGDKFADFSRFRLSIRAIKPAIDDHRVRGTSSFDSVRLGESGERGHRGPDAVPAAVPVDRSRRRDISRVVGASGVQERGASRDRRRGRRKGRDGVPTTTAHRVGCRDRGRPTAEPAARGRVRGHGVGHRRVVGRPDAEQLPGPDIGAGDQQGGGLSE